MNRENIIIRREREEDCAAVENLVRESFWNVYRPGCLEHYVLHLLRGDPAFPVWGTGAPRRDFLFSRDLEEDFCF